MEAHVSLGLARFLGDWDFPAAERSFRRALALQPGDAQARSWYSNLLSATGRHRQAVAEARRAAELDPLSVTIQLNLGIRQYYGRQWGDAIASFRHTLAIDPTFSIARYWLGLALQQSGRSREAIEQLQLYGGPEAAGALAHAFAAAGNRDEAGRMLSDLAPLARSGIASVTPFDMALICVGLGRNDEAIEWLRQTVRQRSPSSTTFAVDPLLHPLRKDARFMALVRQVGVRT